MIEVIAILLIIGIISAVVVSRAVSTDVYRLVSEVEILKGHIRYAQFRAMNDTVSWGIDYTGSSYTLQKNGAAASSNFPNDNSATHVFQTGVSITAGDGTISFDDWGSPGTSDISITLSAGGDSRTITITKNTGFVSIT